jgi:hypothetical protein
MTIYGGLEKSGKKTSYKSFPSHSTPRDMLKKWSYGQLPTTNPHCYFCPPDDEEDPPKPSAIAIAIAGGCAGGGYTLAAVPADVVKSRYQSAPKSRYPGGIPQVTRELFWTMGYRGFFTGLLPAMLRNVPANGACFLGVEVSKKWMDQYF